MIDHTPHTFCQEDVILLLLETRRHDNIIVIMFPFKVHVQLVVIGTDNDIFIKFWDLSAAEELK